MKLISGSVRAHGGAVYDVDGVVDRDGRLQVFLTAQAEQWHAAFQPEYVEELTRKTGSAKTFDTFVAMLESAVQGRDSSSVSLEILTSVDLDRLRAQKRGSRSNSPASSSQKRFIIMTYSTTYDRVHYPLPLVYSGRPDSVRLRQECNAMRRELLSARGADTAGYVRAEQRDEMEAEVAAFKRMCVQLTEEKRQLQDEVRELTSQLSEAKSRAESAAAASPDSGAGVTRKELRSMRELIARLEQEVLEEKMSHRAALRSKAEECVRVARELEEARAEERQLRRQLSHVTPIPSPSATTTTASVARKDGPVRRSARTRARSNSLESITSSQSRHRKPNPHANETSAPRQHHRGRSRTPKGLPPASPRFDPTQWVLERDQRRDQLRRERRERERSRSRSRSRERTAATTAHRLPASRIARRPASASGYWSDDTSNASDSSAGPSRSRSRSRSRPSNTTTTITTAPLRRSASPVPSHQSDKSLFDSLFPSSSANSPLPNQHQQRHTQPTPSTDARRAYEDASADISDIDTRLNRLQAFLRQATL